ncbi:uncharacterized protein LOC111345787 [Stylophora pistillata]|uniref:Uncharacterized protein n=1 Tax=Stylophora pistillata TaxID=50429 RepID=A0A2B4RBI7_STYPI|nr:uncharacterized protein LOC111345787 [Stylophora pistillata]PFX13655.1 hypothetical protein AWC38_SpisGene22247 [Stylophora pistillata]
MKTLPLVLFFGASVALARSPFEHSALDEFSDEERENLLGELADEENDPKFPLPLFPSTLSAKLCEISRGICLALSKNDPCKKMDCRENYRNCIESKLPKPRLAPTVGEKKCHDLDKKCKTTTDCKQKLICMAVVKICLGVTGLKPKPPLY